MTNKEIKLSAKDLTSRYWAQFVVLVVIQSITLWYSQGQNPTIVFPSVIVSSLIGYFWIQTTLHYAKTEDDSSFFSILDLKAFPSWFVTSFMTGIYTLLWFLIPFAGLIIGPVKAYSYMMAPYIAVDNPEIGFNEAIKESIRMMDGYKMQFFVLWLSFLLWSIVVVLTLGIAGLFFQPYMNFAMTMFYLKRKEQGGY